MFIRFCKYLLRIQLSFLIAVLCIPAGIAFAQDGTRQFSIGFSNSLFIGLNENDAKSAIKVWAQVVARERNIDVDPSARLYRRVAEMINDMKNGNVDAMGMTFDEYMVLSKEVGIDHWFLTKIDGEIYVEYIILAQNDEAVGNLREILKENLILLDTARTSLAPYWLDSLMEKFGIPGDATQRFANIEHVEKLSAAVLPVFFGKTDACLVTKSGFSTMVELNPQIGRKLQVIAQSPPLVHGLLCFRKGYNSPQKEEIIAALKDLDNSSAGQQVLTIFQAEALVEVDESVLEKTKVFFNEAPKKRAAR